VVSGLGFLTSSVSVVPFLAGYPKHDRWDPIGKFFLLLSMVFLPVFALTTALTYALWSSLKTLRKISSTYASPKMRNQA
jgi:hypothetical protein